MAGSTFSVPTFSILGADTAIRGDVSASADLHVDGRFAPRGAAAAMSGDGETLLILATPQEPK